MRIQIPTLSLLFALTLSSPAILASNDAKFDVFQIKRQALPLTISVAGTVTAEKAVELDAQIPGRIESITGREGTSFKQGDVLLQIGTEALQAKLDAAKASRATALAAIRNAQVQLDREIYSPQSRGGSTPGGMGMPGMMDQMFTNPMQNMMGMRSTGAERGADLVGAETRITQARSQLLQADSQIREVESALRDARSIAPFDGIIDHVYVEEGDTVQPGTPLLSLSSSKGLQVETDIPVHLSQRIANGASMQVRVDGIAQPIEGKVTRVYPVADAKDHTVHVKIGIPQQQQITAGTYAEVFVPDTTQDNQLLTIPNSAVVKKGGMSLVFKVDNNQVASLRVVRLGKPVTGGHELLAGLDEGDSVLLNPPPGLRSGTSLVQEQADTDKQASAE
ncbi:MAG: efflux RND transporter periplasmic adaptor subunit [bacterium]